MELLPSGKPSLFAIPRAFMKLIGYLRLVATLGSKSTLKKINRRAILDVNVPKACQTIQAPEAPMALRLQSNLL
jgi:hypothetical protein